MSTFSKLKRPLRYLDSPCSRCGGPQDRQGQRYCRTCHAAYVRENRPSYSQLTDEQRKKSNARSYASTYVARGKLKRKPCVDCGVKSAEKHHPDYNQPLLVIWLCRSCHMARHHKTSLAEPESA